MIEGQKGKAATRAKNKYRDKSYSRVEFLGPIGYKEKIEKAVANEKKRRGTELSRNAWIIEAIEEKIERENSK